MSVDARRAAVLAQFLRLLDANIPGLRQQVLSGLGQAPDLVELIDALRVVKMIQGGGIPPEQSLENEARQFLGMPQIP